MVKTFTGKNTFALKAELNKIISSLVKEVGDFSVEQIDASETDMNSILQAVQSLPFLSSKKLVIVSGIESNSDFALRIDELIDRVAGGVEVILLEQNLDKRKTLFKTLQKNSELTDFRELNENDLDKWVVEYAQTINAKVSISDANYLISRVGNNQQQLASELDKLALYDENITRSSIDKLTDLSLQNTIFDLLDSAFSGKKELATLTYKNLREAKLDPQYIISMFVWQLTALALAVFSDDKTESSLVSGGMSPYTARKSLALASRINKNKIRKLIKDLSDLDAQIKTGADADACLELYLLRI